jgi:Protein of unknown function (DUF3300)
MRTQTRCFNLPLRLAAMTVLLFAAASAFAQTPVDEDGNPVGTVYGDAGVGTLMSADELQGLVGRIALYPDDLLAIVLPASTYPLEIVQAARFLEQLESNSDLEPDDSWDDSVVALLNYPEVVQMMNDDIDWTWRLGEAVVAQQNDVVAAVEAFRDRAYAAGNLASDERQTVQRNDGAIEIKPVEDDVIYVPYYEPEHVVIRQPRRVYYYYPRAYPVYYYPYPAGHHFSLGYFWGVTTAFRIGWASDYLHVHHYSYHGHPYFGWNYYDRYYWRRPSIQVFNTYYGGYRDRAYRDRHGDYWRPRHRGGARPGHYAARDRYYTDRRRSSSHDGYARRDRNDSDRRSSTTDLQRRDTTTRTANNRRDAADRRGNNERRDVINTRRDNDTIRFRSRDDRQGGDRTAGTRRSVNDGSNAGARRDTGERREIRGGDANRNGDTVRFRARDESRRSNPPVAPGPSAAGNSSSRQSVNSRREDRTQNANRGSDSVRFRSRETPARDNRRQAQPDRSSVNRSAPVSRSAPVVRSAPASRPAPVQRRESVSRQSAPSVQQRSAPSRRASPERASSSRSAPERRSSAAPSRSSSSSSGRRGGERRERNR